jgi:drug/metabolite transporter (DMT)-like permease
MPGALRRYTKLSAVAIVIALIAAAVWGAADFCGGIASKRSSTLGVLTIGYVLGGALVGVVAVSSNQSWPSASTVGLAAIGGLGGLIGVGFLYAGLASGPMHIVGPVAAGTSAGIPVLWDAVQGDLPQWLAIVGLLITLVAIVLLGLAPSHSAVSASSTRGLLLGLAAGVGFASYFVAIGETPGDQNLTVVAAARAVCIPALAVAFVWKRPTLPTGRTAGLALLGGALDVCANVGYSVAVDLGSTSIVSVISSLYPAFTIALARFLLGERISKLQSIGLTIGAIGVTLVAIGSHL